MDFVTSTFGFNLFLFALGVWLLIKGSDGIIQSASIIAHHYHIPDIVIGLTLVSIGTSLPELATNVYASVIGQGVVAMGNVVGSNITNVLLVAGIAITGLGTIKIDAITFWRDAAVMFGVYLLFSLFCYFFHGIERTLGRGEGIILFVAFFFYTVYLIRSNGKGVEKQAEGCEQESARQNMTKSLFYSLGACFMVIVGAKLMVDNVIWMARKLDVPEEIISGTVIALGTSLPEVSVTIAGILKKKKDIALGNIIGSNTFNIILVMSITAIINPVPISAEIRDFMLPYMMCTGFLFVIFMRISWCLVRWQGIVFLIGYLFFIFNNLKAIAY